MLHGFTLSFLLDHANRPTHSKPSHYLQVNADPEPEPVFFATGNAAPLPTEHVILALLVAYHELDDDVLSGWCKDVLVQESRWSEVSG